MILQNLTINKLIDPYEISGLPYKIRGFGTKYVMFRKSCASRVTGARFYVSSHVAR